MEAGSSKVGGPLWHLKLLPKPVQRPATPQSCQGYRVHPTMNQLTLHGVGLSPFDGHVRLEARSTPWPDSYCIVQVQWQNPPIRIVFVFVRTRYLPR